MSGNCVTFCKSALSLLVWLLSIIHASAEREVASSDVDKALGLPSLGVDGAFSYRTLIERASDCIEKLMSSDSMLALLRVAEADDKGLLAVCFGVKFVVETK